MRARFRRFFAGQTMPLPLVVILILVSLPVTVPLALIQQSRIDRRKRRRAETQRCGRCGAGLGLVALAQADAAWATHVEQLHRERPHIRFRLIRTVWAICAGCGQEYNYDETADEFVLPKAAA